MFEKPKPLTKAEILSLYPPEHEVLDIKGGIVDSQISRTSDGKIVFVVPGSTKWIKEPPNDKRGKE